MAKEYKTTAHAIYNIQYHLVWCTKYRYPVLRGHIGERCRDLLRQIAMAREITSKLVQYLKGRSSRKLQMEYDELKRRYWGQHLWARGYFCATVGTVTAEMIKKYIEEQTWQDDGGKGFKIVSE